MQSGSARLLDALQCRSSYETDTRAHSIHCEVREAGVPAWCPKLQRLQNSSRDDSDQCDFPTMTGIAESEDQSQKYKGQKVLLVVLDARIGAEPSWLSATPR
jgi:hypothetical protein